MGITLTMEFLASHFHSRNYIIYFEVRVRSFVGNITETFVCVRRGKDRNK